MHTVPTGTPFQAAAQIRRLQKKEPAIGLFWIFISLEAGYGDGLRRAVRRLFRAFSSGVY
jgi:hypothetical protein